MPCKSPSKIEQNSRLFSPLFAPRQQPFFAALFHPIFRRLFCPSTTALFAPRQPPFSPPGELQPSTTDRAQKSRIYNFYNYNYFRKLIKCDANNRTECEPIYNFYNFYNFGDNFRKYKCLKLLKFYNYRNYGNYGNYKKCSACVGLCRVACRLLFNDFKRLCRGVGFF